MTDSHTVIVAIEGEPFLSRAVAYRRDWTSACEAWNRFAATKGAEGAPEIGGGLNFGKRKAPAGWTRAKGPDGYSRPKPGSPDAEAMASLPSIPSPRDVFAGAIIEEVRYQGDDVSGMTSVCRDWRGATIGWTTDAYVAVIPDASAAARQVLETNPGVRITNGADLWTLPSGLRQITKARMEFMFAKFMVEHEEAAKAA